MPIAGKFRLVNVPISNCLHSGVERIYVLTQFNSVSLNRYIAQAYRFDSYRSGFVQILAAQQTLDGGDWYQGTADAIRRNESYIISPTFPDEHILILAGDHLYRMDYRKMLEVHVNSQADIMISVIPVHQDVVSGLGFYRLMGRDELSILGRTSSLRTCFKKKDTTQELMFTFNHWSSRILTQ